MRTKSIMLLVVALGFGVIASVAVTHAVLDQRNRGATKTIPILVVAKEISAATKITAESFRVEEWPVDRIPVGAIADPKLVENKFSKQRFYPGEPIIEAKLSGKGREFTVPEGYRLFDIAVKEESGGVGYIGPGDHVDVYGFFEKGPRVKTAKSVKVMENLEVVMVDGVATIDHETTKQKKSNTIQVLVKDSQFIVLDTASNLAGRLRLALRPPTQIAPNGGEPDDGEKFLSWLKESETAVVEKERAIAETPIQAPAVPPEKEKHEMMIVTTSKSTMYRFNEGQAIPQKLDLDRPEPTDIASVGPSQSQSQSPSPTVTPPPTKPANSSQTPADSQPAQTIPPVDPEDSVQPNLIWDPASGNWQSGGFKAIYPKGK